MNDHGISEIRSRYHSDWLKRRLWAISENPDGSFTVHEHSPGGVAPPTEYQTMRKAASRLLQIMGTGVVPPQTWPESVCIVAVDIAKDQDSN